MEEKPPNDAALSIPGEYGHPIPRELMLRELGFNGPFSRHSVGKAIVSGTLKTKAVHTMCTKNTLKKKNFRLPAGARTTFHMAFSPDGTKVASCHGDHNVYVSEISTLKVVKTLTGHPRTPWCVVFHPTQNDVLASGCLAGHVRVWDLNGGSELLVCDSGTVIASLSFHPTVRLLAIATFNEIIFWDWALGPYPLARCSTGNTKEKVRLVRFDRLGHSLVTGITNFPNPPNVGGGEAEASRSSRTDTRDAFRPNILSRTPQATTSAAGRSPVQLPFPVDEIELPLPEGVVVAIPDASAEVSVAEALTERQERFQESYRQLVNHYEDLVQHYQQFLRTRLGVAEPPTVMDFIPISDSDDTSPEASNDSPPIDIVVSENPSIMQSVAAAAEMVDSSVPLVIIHDELPGPSSRVPVVPVIAPQAEPVAGPSSAPTTSTSGNPLERGSSSDLQSIQALEQNILEMQNLCSQARRDSTNFSVEPVHIQELRTIRRHLEVLQDQTRRLQSSIRQTLSSLARGTGGIEALRGRLTSIIPGSANSVEVGSSNQITVENGSGREAPVNSVSTSTEAMITAVTNETTPTNNERPLTDPPAASPSTSNIPAPMQGSERERRIRYIVGFQSSRARGRFSVSQRAPPAVPMQYSGNTPNPNPPAVPPRLNPPESQPTTSATYQQTQAHARYAAATRFAREFMTEAVHEHSRFCPYGEGNVSRPPSRMRCVSDLGETPVLAVWPTVETGHERSVRNFRLSPEDTRAVVPYSGNAAASSASGSTERNNSHGDGMNFPSFGSWMGQGPTWINNDLGVRVYLTVRQFNERINSLRNEREQLLAERAQLLSRRARATTALARAERARENDSGESWQRNFQSGVALVPSCVREGARVVNNRGRISRYSPGATTSGAESGSGRSGNAARTVPIVVHSRAHTHTQGEQAQSDRSSRAQPTTSGSSRREPPRQLAGNFQRSTLMRIGEETFPVYSHLTDRDVPQQNIFVFPTGLFLEGSGWNTDSIGIYWPHVSREEEETLAEFRRTESLIPVFTVEAERLMDARSTRYRIEYDSTQLTIHVAEGYSLTFIQPGLTLLDAISTMANFQRPRENSGAVYITHLSPFLDAVERIFGYRRRREFVGSYAQAAAHGSSGTLRLSTVLQPGPFNLTRAVQISIRTRRSEEVTTRDPPTAATPSVISTQYDAGAGPGPSSLRAAARASALANPSGSGVNRNVSLRLRRDLVREWVGSGSVYRNGSSSGSGPTTSSDAHPELEPQERGSEPYNSPAYEQFLSQRELFRQRMEDLRRLRPRTDEELFGRPSDVQYNEMLRQRERDRDRRLAFARRLDAMRAAPPLSPASAEGDVAGSDSASLASTRRVIRLAVATAASNVLRRSSSPYSHHSHLSSDFHSYQTNPSRAIESRIERVLNERGNRGVDSPLPQPGNQSASTQTIVCPVWGVPLLNEETPAAPSTDQSTETVQAAAESLVTESPPRQRIEDGDNPFPPLPLPLSTQSTNIMETRPVTSARPLRRPYARISGRFELTDDDSDDEPIVIVSRRSSAQGEPRRGYRERDESPVRDHWYHRRRGIRELRHRTLHRDSADAGPSARRRRGGIYSTEAAIAEARLIEAEEAAEAAAVERERHRYPSAAGTVEWVPRRSRRRGVPEEATTSSARREREPRGATGPTTSSSNSQAEAQLPSMVSHYFRRVPYPTQDVPPPGLNNQPMDDPHIGARFYPGYIPEIVITPRSRPQNYYTLDASTTAFLSSRIQKWDFSTFLIPNIQAREENIVVKECSLHSDACLDMSNDGDFVAVCIPSDSGSYSAVGIYSIRNESLGDIIHMFHFDQNTVSVSISPSCDYVVVGYAGRGGPLYRFVQQSRSIGQVATHYSKIGKILSLTRDVEGGAKLVSVKELYADNQSTIMSINCMHWVPISGYGIIYGTNTGDLVLLS